MFKATLAALCVAFFALQAHANEPQVGTGLVCDTGEQAIMFASLYDEKGAAAVQAVNDNAKDPMACLVATVALVKIEVLATAKVAGRDVEITKVLVIGIVDEGRLTPTPPKEFYMLFPAAGFPA